MILRSLLGKHIGSPSYRTGSPISKALTTRTFVYPRRGSGRFRYLGPLNAVPQMVLDHLKMSLWYASRNGLIHVSYYGDHIDGVKHEMFYGEQRPCAYELIAHIDYERDGDDISVNTIDVFHISDAGENRRHTLALIPEDDEVMRTKYVGRVLMPEVYQDRYGTEYYLIHGSELLRTNISMLTHGDDSLGFLYDADSRTLKVTPRGSRPYEFIWNEDIILYRNRTTGYIDRVKDRAITDVTFVLL